MPPDYIITDMVNSRVPINTAKQKFTCYNPDFCSKNIKKSRKSLHASVLRLFEIVGDCTVVALFFHAGNKFSNVAALAEPLVQIQAEDLFNTADDIVGIVEAVDILADVAASIFAEGIQQFES